MASKGLYGSKRTTLVLELILLAAGAGLLLAVLFVYLLAPLEPPAPLQSQGVVPITTLTSESVLEPARRPAVNIPPTYAAPDRPAATAVGAGPLGVLVASDLEPEPASDPAGRQPVRLVIPALAIDAPVEPVGVMAQAYEDRYYAQWIVPNRYAAGWHVSSAPLGQPGNTVLNGHNNVHGAIFRDLADLAAGDEIILYDAAIAHRYRVTERILLEERGQSLQIRSQNARFMLSTSDERITLVSCWPRASSTHRLIVIAHPFEDSG